MRFVVTADARALRRGIGATAWAVLEELLLDAEPDDAGRLVARTNVRRLAGQLGVSKDTAARAVNRLARAGVVTRVMSERGERGALPTSTYEIDLCDVDGITVDIAPNASAAPLRAPRARTSSRATSLDTNAQVSLFDLPASTS